MCSKNGPNGSKRDKFSNYFYHFSAGEWFKEELRELGGLDHLVKTMSDCVGFLMAGKKNSKNFQILKKF